MLRALAGSAIMGGGIATMHYTGMAAMRLLAMCSYDPLLLTLSVVFAIVISLFALWLTFCFREDRKRPVGGRLPGRSRWGPSLRLVATGIY
jgi:NO-binding membrane sensor protein with MHYT domain